MAFCTFGHFSLVSKISQMLLELEPHNLINRLVVMRRKVEGHIASGHELCPFVNLGIFHCQHNISKTVGARVS